MIQFLWGWMTGKKEKCHYTRSDKEYLNNMQSTLTTMLYFAGLHKDIEGLSVKPTLSLNDDDKLENRRW